MRWPTRKDETQEDTCVKVKDLITRLTYQVEQRTHHGEEQRRYFVAHERLIPLVDGTNQIHRWSFDWERELRRWSRCEVVASKNCRESLPDGHLWFEWWSNRSFWSAGVVPKARREDIWSLHVRVLCVVERGAPVSLPSNRVHWKRSVAHEQ